LRRRSKALSGGEDVLDEEHGYRLEQRAKVVQAVSSREDNCEQ
jgi:hypothetical protein